jgi:type III pantothenate kinase
MIFCDIGNTTFHFKTKTKDFKANISDSIKSIFLKKKTIYFISVNEKATKKLLKYYPNAINIEKDIQFKTLYKGMGIDRKVTCINISNGIIIDAGSAITVDIMKDGKHLGGFILPGILVFSKIYPIISKKLSFQFSNNINLDKMPLNTNDAINYAILNAIIAPIKNIYDKYNLPLYFTGGDGKVLSKYFKRKIYIKDLIFKSMKRIIKSKKGK